MADATNALTPESAHAGEGLQAVTVDVEGLVVVTQSCDVVRSCNERPFVEVSPLVQVPASAISEIARGRRPAYTIVPAVKERALVAHLDRVMTVEKTVLASWTRTAGCATDQERRDFARALVRKRARAAFPDDFVEIAANLLKRLQSKLDEAWRRQGLHSRMDLFRKSLQAFLESAGEADVAAMLASTDA